MRDAALDLRAHKVRSVLAALGLFIAILSLVAVTTIGTVVREVFVAQDEQMNGRLWTMATTLDYGLITEARLTEVTKELDRQVSATGGHYALQMERPGEAAPILGDFAGESESLRIVLATVDLNLVRRMPVLGGTWLPAGEAVFPDGVVLNDVASRQLGGSVGSRLRIRLSGNLLPYDRPVIGVVADGRREPRIYQSLRSALHFNPSITSHSGQGPELLVHYPGASQAMIREKMRDIDDALAAQDQGADPQLTSSLADFLISLERTQRLISVVAAVTLFVAVVGLLNIGLATLRERTRELSLRRAIGATRKRVLGLVLTTTLTLSTLAAALAIGIAYIGVTWYVPRVLDPASAIDQPGFPWQAAVYGFIAAVAAGLSGGLVPAIAAARVDMIRVLRE
ncbi:ABC transporter permease [Micromonospora sp. NPDC047134]|uniref:ABC transporter permease n=1 Tax=Micromonospora sp. NPDC047134 TaxID=3154340 RepID=UPI0033E9C1B3